MRVDVIQCNDDLLGPQLCSHTIEAQCKRISIASKLGVIQCNDNFMGATIMPPPHKRLNATQFALAPIVDVI